MIEPIKEAKHKPPSNRSFGLMMIFVGSGLSAWFYQKSNMDTSISFAYVTLTLSVITLIIPKALYPFNRAWHELGLLSGKIVSPIVLGVIFFAIITPVAVITRAFGRDPLHLKRKVGTQTFWVYRSADTLPADSFKNQF
jgi:multisubunit Na+/H+ antiporter MnhG subunit